MDFQAPELVYFLFHSFLENYNFICEINSTSHFIFTHIYVYYTQALHFIILCNIYSLKWQFIFNATLVIQVEFGPNVQRINITVQKPDESELTLNNITGHQQIICSKTLDTGCQYVAHTRSYVLVGNNAFSEVHVLSMNNYHNDERI